MRDGVQKGERGGGRGESEKDGEEIGESRVEGLEEREKRSKGSVSQGGIRRFCWRGWGAERPQRLERISVRGIHARNRNRKGETGYSAVQCSKRRAEQGAEQKGTRH